MKFVLFDPNSQLTFQKFLADLLPAGGGIFVEQVVGEDGSGREEGVVEGAAHAPTPILITNPFKFNTHYPIDRHQDESELHHRRYM